MDSSDLVIHNGVLYYLDEVLELGVEEEQQVLVLEGHHQGGYSYSSLHRRKRKEFGLNQVHLLVLAQLESQQDQRNPVFSNTEAHIIVLSLLDQEGLGDFHIALQFDFVNNDFDVLFVGEDEALVELAFTKEVILSVNHVSLLYLDALFVLKLNDCLGHRDHFVLKQHHLLVPKSSQIRLDVVFVEHFLVDVDFLFLEESWLDLIVQIDVLSQHCPALSLHFDQALLFQVDLLPGLALDLLRSDLTVILELLVRDGDVYIVSDFVRSLSRNEFGLFFGVDDRSLFFNRVEDEITILAFNSNQNLVVI